MVAASVDEEEGGGGEEDGGEVYQGIRWTWIPEKRISKGLVWKKE